MSDVGDQEDPRKWLCAVQAAVEEMNPNSIYKRTHSGDPDPVAGVSAITTAWVRSKAGFDAVIGIGGIGPEPKRNRIAGKLTWIGIGPHKLFNNPNKPNNPRVTFDHYWYRGESGPQLEVEYPALAKRMYEKNVRVLVHKSVDNPGRTPSSWIEKLLEFSGYPAEHTDTAQRASD